MNNIEGKRFYAAIVGIFVISVVTILLKFSAKDYITLFGLAYGTYATAQTITDIVENKNGGQK